MVCCLPNGLFKKKIRQDEQGMNERGVVTEEEELKGRFKARKIYCLGNIKFLVTV